MATKKVQAVCDTHCLQKCRILAHVENGKIIKVEPANFPDKRYNFMCLKGKARPQHVHHPDRLRYPLKKVPGEGKSKWKRISWDKAYDIVANRFIDIARKNGTNSVALLKGAGALGVLSQSPLRLWNLFQGTRIWGGIDSAGPQATEDTLGTGWWLTPGRQNEFGGSNEIIDCGNSNMTIVWGANPAETDPRNWRFILASKSRGTKLIVIDPRRTPTASKADRWISIKPGTDAALALGMMNVILRNNLTDRSFINNYTVGPFLVRNDNHLFLREHDVLENGSKQYMVWDPKSEEARPHTDSKDTTLTGTYEVGGIECSPAFQLLEERALQFPPEKVESITGVDKLEVINLGKDYARNKPSSIYLIYGLDRWYYANIIYRSIITLAALTGQIGISGGGFYFASGPHLVWNPDAWMRPTGSRFTILNPARIYDASARSNIKALWICSANIFAFPNQNKIEHFLNRLEFIVVQDHFLTPTAEFADVILPACTCLERVDVHFGPFPYVQLSQKAIDPLYESKSDLEITSELANRMGFGKYFNRNPEEYIKLVLKGTGISLKRLKKEGIVQIKPLERPFISFKDKKFLTPSGKVEFYIERDANMGQELPTYIDSKEGPNGRQLAQKYPLIFLQSHSRFHSHSMFAKNQMLRKIDPEPVLEINPKDAKIRGIENGNTVLVFNDRGNAKLKAKIEKGIRQGVVNINHGWWPDQFEEGGYQYLTHEKTSPSLRRPNFAYFDCLVEVKKTYRK